MAVIVIYVAIVLIGDAGVVLIAGAVEQYSKSASLMIFFVLFATVFWLGWVLSVRIAERVLKIQG